MDVRGNPGLTCGTSFFLGKSCSLDLGYEYNMLPELRPELGRASTIQAVFAVRF